MIKQTPQGAQVTVHVVPGSSSFSVVGMDEWTGDIKIKVKAKATNGKANQELINELRKMLSADVKIILGHKSRRKTLLVAGDVALTKKLVK